MEKFLSKELFSLRAAVYAAAVGGVFQTIVMLSKVYSWEQVALEGGFVEVFQTALIAVCAVAFLYLAALSSLVRPVCAILAILSIAAVVREFNNAAWYTRVLPESWMKSAIGLGLVAAVLFRYRRGFWRGARAMASRPSATLFVFGFGLVTLWAQTLAQRPLWTFQDDRLLEECIELAGYLLIFFGVVEAWLEVRSETPEAGQLPEGRPSRYQARERSRIGEMDSITPNE